MLEGQFTLGVEEEYQIVEPESRELRSYVSRLVEDGRSVLRERVRPEMHQSMVEVGTAVCNDVQEVRRELSFLRRELNALALKGGLRVVAGSTHPFSDWKKQDITDHERYHGLVEEMQYIARANLIFGLHVHVGVADREDAITLANQVRYFLPHLLALTTSSPFWLGRNTGLASVRCEIFKRFPRTGIPDEFPSYSDFMNLVETLVRSHCIDNAKKIWWDVRVHPFFDTVEVRVCDMPTRLDHTIAVVALTQALMVKLYLLRRQNIQWRSYHRSLIEENKWRAVRYGIHGKLIDLGKCTEVWCKDLIHELVEFVDEGARMLGTQDEVRKIEQILDGGTSADHQLRVFEETHDIKAVVDWMTEETVRDLGDPGPPVSRPPPAPKHYEVQGA